MTLIYTHELTQGQLPPGVQQIYNGLDVCLTHEVHSAIHAHHNAIPVVYSFERALQAPALEMMLRGFRIDEFARQQGMAALREKLDHLNRVLNALSYAVWDKPLNPRSPKQLLDFFYGTMRLPEQWTSKKGVRKLSMDREALEKLWLYFPARPIISTILAIRENGKKLEVLETEVDPDGRMRTSYNIAGTETWRFSSSANVTGAGCVQGHCEVLTTQGWLAIKDFKNGTFAAQWDPETSEIKFLPADLYIGHCEKNMLRVRTEQIEQLVTLQHRVPFYDSRMRNLQIQPANTVCTYSQVALPLGGLYTAGTESYPRFLAMLMADGSKDEYSWNLSFKKQRKIDRFLELAEEFEFEYRENSTNREGYRRFKLFGCQHFPKKWGPWVLDLTPECREELLQEACYWDAHERYESYIFYTSSKEQADWFAIMAHLTERSVTVHEKVQSEGSYSNTLMYWVNVKPRNHARVMRKHWSVENYSGEVFCLTTQTGCFLIRQNGKISVTGNTNLQNITPELRNIFAADPGYKLVGIDLEQAESREVGWLCGVLFGDWAYLDACYSGDLHTLVAKGAWPELLWPGSPKEDRALAEEPFYRHLSRRDLSKRLGHGSNYFGQPYTMARHTKVSAQVVQRFQDNYFARFPGIPKWHRWTAQCLQTTQSVTTPFGLTRHFFGRPNDDTTLREAIAFSPQSSTAVRLNLILWRIWKHMPQVQLLAQVHDALYFQFPEHLDEREVISEALSHFHIPMEHQGHVLRVPGEAKSGWNWANYHPTSNPDGLKKFNPTQGDSRVRTTGLNRVM